MLFLLGYVRIFFGETESCGGTVFFEFPNEFLDHRVVDLLEGVCGL